MQQNLGAQTPKKHLALQGLERIRFDVRETFLVPLESMATKLQVEQLLGEASL